MWWVVAIRSDITQQQPVFPSLQEVEQVLINADNTYSDPIRTHIWAIKRSIETIKEKRKKDQENWILSSDKIWYDVDSSRMILQWICDNDGNVNNMYDISLYVLLCLLQENRQEFEWGKSNFRNISKNKLQWFITFVLTYLKESETPDSLKEKLIHLWFTRHYLSPLFEQANLQAAKTIAGTKNNTL